MISLMPLLWPQMPSFANDTELRVWEALRDQLGDNDLLISNVRLNDRERDYEVDHAIVFHDAGVVVVETKGGPIWKEGPQWMQGRAGNEHKIDPVEQALRARHALETYIGNTDSWGSRGRIRYAHAVCFPDQVFDQRFDTPDCHRWMVIDHDDMSSMADELRNVVLMQDTNRRSPDGTDTLAIVEALDGRMLPQRDSIGEAVVNDEVADRLTQEQSVILDAARLLTRIHVRGGAGSGKTWLAMEQARRLTRRGQRVALISYSRGLSAWMQRRVATFEPKDRPAYVGTFHGLGEAWGAPLAGDDGSNFWEKELPDLMVELATALPEGKRFDAIVIDEAQDFADTWWPAVFAALKHDDGGLYVFSDEGQQVFSRFAGGPSDLVPLILDQNLRNTRQISETFSAMVPIRMKAGTTDGPAVRLESCRYDQALERADDVVDELLEQGWKPSDIAVLATGPRHPEQTNRQADGQSAYWDSFWDDEQVFYGHVLGFKGLDHSVIVLAVNERPGRERAKERLYVGLSRARNLLVVCGDPQHLKDVGGPSMLKKMGVDG